MNRREFIKKSFGVVVCLVVPSEANILPERNCGVWPTRVSPDDCFSLEDVEKIRQYIENMPMPPKTLLYRDGDLLEYTFSKEPLIKTKR